MNETEKYLIIYHKEDNDGVFSAGILCDYLIRTKLISKNDVALFGADYNDLSKISLDIIKAWPAAYKKVALLDISFNEYEKMEMLYKLYEQNFIWCDHHAPVIKRMSALSNVNGLRDINNSAIINVWRYLYDCYDLKWSTRSVPTIYRILSAWDSWSYEREHYDFKYVRTINIGITVYYNLNVEQVLTLINDVQNKYEADELEMPESWMNLIYDTGQNIIKYQDAQNENLINQYGDCSWTVDDEKTCVMFMQGSSNSIMFKSLDNNGDVKHGAIFKRNKDSSWTLSLYNINNDIDFNCGEYLKMHYNGGGHKGAAGCTMTEEKFIELLTSHKI